MKFVANPVFGSAALAISLTLVSPLLAQLETHLGSDRAPAPGSDPVFAAIPFDQWVKEGGAGNFRWSARVTAGGLSHHQRLLARFEVQVDGSEMVARKGHNQLLLMVQFTDGDNRVFQTHQALDLDDVKDETGKSNINYSQQAFVTPGDYHVAFAIVDAKTGEHGVLQKTLHVNSLHNDPLPESWAGIPAVEFEQEVKPPDQLFLPYLTGRLHLPLKTARAVRIDVMVNAAPASAPPPIRMPVLGQTQPLHNPRDVSLNQKLGVVIAAMKVISALDVSNGSLRISLLDLERRKLLFDQKLFDQNITPDEAAKSKASLDWPKMRNALQEADPNKIDVASLAHRDETAQFFVDQVLQRSKPVDGAQQVLLILSGPTPLSGPLSGDDQRAALAAQRGVGKIYYVRYHTLLAPEPQIAQPNFGRRGSFPPNTPSPSAGEPFDSLGGLLKPLQPRVFDVYSPEQFRKALATMMDEISKM